MWRKAMAVIFGLSIAAFLTTAAAAFGERGQAGGWALNTAAVSSAGRVTTIDAWIIVACNGRTVSIITCGEQGRPPAPPHATLLPLADWRSHWHGSPPGLLQTGFLQLTPTDGMRLPTGDSGDVSASSSFQGRHRFTTSVSWVRVSTLLAWTAAIPLVLGITACFLRLRTPTRMVHGHCRCGYDLRASPDRCPECGATHSSCFENAGG